MAIYTDAEIIEKSHGKAEGHIFDFTQDGYGVDEPWEGKNLIQIEDYVCGAIEKLSDNSDRRVITIAVTSGIRSFLNSTSLLNLTYHTNYTIGSIVLTSCYVEIAVEDTTHIIHSANESTNEEHSFNLAPYLIGATPDENNQITVYLTAYDIIDTEGTRKSTTTVLKYTKRAAYLEALNPLGYDISVTGYVSYFAEVENSSSATLNVQFYNGSIPQAIKTTSVTTQGNYNMYPDSLEMGVHRVVAWLSFPDGLETTRIENSVIVSTGAVDGTIFIVSKNFNNAVVNDYISIPYSVTKAGASSTDEIVVALQEYVGTDYVTRALRRVVNGLQQSWNYLVSSENNHLRLLVPIVNSDGTLNYNSTNSLSIIVTANQGIPWEQAKDGLLFYLTAHDKSNSDYDVGTLEDNGYGLEYEDMQWSTSGSGYYEVPTNDKGEYDETSAKKVTAVCLEGSSTAHTVIAATKEPYAPLYSTAAYIPNVEGGGVLATGRTIKVSFMVTNVSNPNGKIISCWDDTSDSGFYVTTDALYIKIKGKELVSLPNESQSKSGHNERHFVANKRYDITLVIESYYIRGALSEHKVKYFINGETAGFTKLSDADTTYSQNSAIPLTFKGDSARLFFFDVRCYNRALSDYEVLQTRTIDLGNSAEITSIFNKNNFYTRIDGNPVITLDKAIAYGKWLAEQGKTNFAVWTSTNLCNGSAYYDNTKSHSTRPESMVIFRFTTNLTGQGIIDPDLTILVRAAGINQEKQESYLRLRRQGTSTAKATKGNIRADVVGTCIIHKWNPATQSFYADNSENRAASYVYEVGKKAKIWLIPDASAIPCYLLTFKKNPNESTQARNLPTAKWYEDCCRRLAKYTEDSGNSYPYEKCLTMPQRRELETIKAVHPDWSRSQQIDAIKTRQAIDGIPSLGFEMDYDGDMLNPINNTSSFGGQFDIITDKTNMEVFGFGGFNSWDSNDNVTFNPWGKGAYVNQPDEDFSIEWRRNDSKICNFLTADLSGLSGDEEHSVEALDLDYRYPEPNGSSKVISWSGAENESDATIGMEKSGTIQKFFDFIMTCNISGVKTEGQVFENGKNINTGTEHLGQIPITWYAGTRIWTATVNGDNISWTSSIASTDGNTWVPDTIAGRLSKFKTEHSHFTVVPKVLFNGVAIQDGAMVDQNTKNQFFTYFTNELDAHSNKLLTLLGYDFDSSWSCDNDCFFRFDYTLRYSDALYDGQAQITLPGGSQVVLGPEYWKLVFACYKAEMHDIRNILYQSKHLTKEGLLSYMHDNQVDIYNSIQYNANSEYSYTSIEADYPKAHGAAKEHTEWFIGGRMHFISGEDFTSTNDTGSDFARNPAIFNLSHIAEITGKNSENRGKDNWKLTVTGYERTHAALTFGVTPFVSVPIEVTQAYDADGQPIGDPIRTPAYLTAPGIDASGAGDIRFSLYGGKFLKTIEGLSCWYISGVQNWGDLTNIEDLEIGSNEYWLEDGDEDIEENREYYTNPVITSLNTGGVVFGSCKKLNLAGCTHISSVDLTKFPILEEFDGGRMTSATNISLPLGNSLTKVVLPANLTSLNITNKPNLTTFSIAGTDNMSEVTVNITNNNVAIWAIDTFL